jgi:hypothetical protein
VCGGCELRAVVEHVMGTCGEDEQLINNSKYMMRDSGAHIEVSE